MTVKVVFLHGFLGSGRNWTSTIQGLSSQLPSSFEFLAVDLLWHANRRPIEAAEKQDPLEQMVAALSQDVGSEPFYAVAHSFGLRPLLRYTTQFPEKVLGIVAEDTSPSLSEGGYSLLSSILTGSPVPFNSRQQAKDFFMAEYGLADLATFLQSNLIWNDNKQLVWRFDAPALIKLLECSRSHDLWKEWEEYRGPLKLVLGGDSQTVSADSLGKCKKLRSGKGLSVDVIEGSGHWVHYEKPELFVQIVQDFLMRHA